jgi:hypothetical protein
MNGKLLKLLIYLAGAFCVFAFVATRSLPVFNSVMKEKSIPEHWEFTKYGELYYFNYISQFKEDLPWPIRKYRLTEKHPGLTEAEIIMFGDSFLDFSRQVTLPERVADSLGVKVHYHRFLDPNNANPLCVFSENRIDTASRRIVVYQSVERNIPVRFEQPYDVHLCPEDTSGANQFTIDKISSEIFPWNTEEMYRQFLKRSVFTTGLFALNSQIKFDLFGYISSQTPVYKTGNDPWLFFVKQLDDEPGSYYYHHSDEQIERYCNNIAHLAKELKKLNLDMIFLPVPNKYTIYHSVVNNDPYDQFLPRMYAGLKERNIPCVELYDEYLKADEVLYYGTDTHWNKKGVDIALRKLISQLHQLNPENI